MNIFDRIRKTFGAKAEPDALTLQRLIEIAETDLADRRVELAKLEAAHGRALLGGEKARQDSRSRIDGVERDVRDIERAVETLRLDLATAEHAAEQDRRRTVYAAAVAEQQAAIALFLKGYEPAALAIAQIIEVMARADLAILKANAQLPDGTEPLAEAEIAARLTGAEERHLIRKTRVEKWVEVGSSTPIDDNLVPRVEVHPKTGRAFIRPLMVAAPGYDEAARQRAADLNRAAIRYVERMEFWRIEEAEAASGAMPMPLKAITLPAARGGGADIWTAVAAWSGPAAVLMAADEREAERRVEPQQPTIRTSVRYTAVTGEAAEDEGEKAA